MHAIRLHSFGSADQLVLDEVPTPVPSPGEVRITVSASGVHLLDVSLRRGEAGPLPLPDLPTVPGREVAGIVDLLGDGVSPEWLGRRVVAHLGPVPGGYAESAVTAVQNLIVVADQVTFPEAVAAVGTGRTALGILELEPPTATDVVVVLSAAGGLGWLLVQAAQGMGASVVAAARGRERTARLRELGPDLVLDYGDPEWAAALAGLSGSTLVYDGVGGEVGRQALESLRPGGRLVMFGYSAGSPTRFDTDDVVARGLTVGWSLGPRMLALPGGVRGLAERSVQRVAAGTWRPLVSTYPLADAAQAHADLEGRRALGKVVLTSAGERNPMAPVRAVGETPPRRTS